MCHWEVIPFSPIYPFYAVSSSICLQILRKSVLSAHKRKSYCGSRADVWQRRWTRQRVLIVNNTSEDSRLKGLKQRRGQNEQIGNVRIKLEGPMIYTAFHMYMWSSDLVRFLQFFIHFVFCSIQALYYRTESKIYCWKMLHISLRSMSSKLHATNEVSCTLLDVQFPVESLINPENRKREGNKRSWVKSLLLS